KGRMGGGQRLLVIDFAVGGQAAVESRTVPRCNTHLVIGIIFLGIIPFALDLVRVTDHETAAALRDGSVESDAWACLHAVFFLGEIFLAMLALARHMLCGAACSYRGAHQRERNPP